MEILRKMMESRILLLEKESNMKDDIIKDLSVKLKRFEEEGMIAKPKSNEKTEVTKARKHVSTNTIHNIWRKSCPF